MPRLLCVFLVLLLTAAAPLAQEAPVSAAMSTMLRVATDCRTGGCDRAFFQTELPWVQFVRDQGNADVYVLINEDDTGGGGERYTLFFQGRGKYTAQENTLTVTVGSDATDDDERRAIASRLALGLAAYVAQTPLAGRLAITYAAPEGAGQRMTPEDDPWNGWTFRLQGNSYFDGESSYSSFNGYGNVSAERVSDLWKARLGVSGSYGRDTFGDPTGSIAGSDTTYVSEQSGYSTNGLVARSLGDRLSAGLEVGASSNTFSNYRARLIVGPGVEVSLFPYSESTRRLVTASYGLALEAATYRDSTVFGVISETLPQHSARFGAEFAQPWGSVDVSLSAQQYLSQLDKYEVGLGGNFNVRLARGLQLNVGGSASIIENQLSLSAQGLTPEEILTRQQQQATTFRYYGNVGLSYSFGSIFNSVVNPRFSNGGVIVFG